MSGLLPVVAYPTALLRQKSEPVVDDSDTLRLLADQMRQLLKVTGAGGISAVQLGVPVRVCMVRVKPPRDGSNPDGVALLINPELVYVSPEQVVRGERCLSLPKANLHIPRAAKVVLAAWTLKREKVTITAEGLEARLVLHELDHLDGKLLVDHCEPWKRERIDRNLAGFRDRVLHFDAMAAEPDDPLVEVVGG